MTFNEVIEGIVKIVSVLTPIALAWFGIVQSKMSKKQNVMETNQHDMKENQKEMNIKVDGHLSKLLSAVEQGQIDKGRLEEKEHSEGTTAALNEKLVEASKQIPTADTKKDAPAEVKVVNVNPIDVKNIDNTKTK